MKGSVLSRRYAVALADVAEKEDCLDQVRDELKALAAALHSDRLFTVFANTQGYGSEGKRKTFRTLAEKLNLSGATTRLLDYLVVKKRTSLLPKLAQSFSAEADKRLGISEARLASAHKLTDEQRGAIVRKLEHITSNTIRVHEEIDESLIAGFQVHMDGRFYDGSLRGRLESLKERMIHGE